MENFNGITPEQQEALNKKMASNQGTDQFVTGLTVEAPVQPKLSLKEQILMMERELEGTPKVQEKVTTNYKDELGNDTYYVQNISDGHVTTTDPDMIIQKGQVADLLQMAKMEELNACRDLRTCRHNGQLKRLTELEYFTIRKQQLEIRKKLDMLSHQQELQRMKNTKNPNSDNQNNPSYNSEQDQVRPVISDRLNKLSLASSKDPEVASHGWSSIQFIDWMMSEFLTQEELGYILEHPSVSRYHDIKAQVIQKKAMI